MDTPGDHLEREIAGLRAELGTIARRLNELERTAREARLPSGVSASESAPPMTPPTPPTGAAPPITPPTPPPGPSVTSDAQASVDAARRRALEHLRAPHAVRATKEAWSIERLIGAKAFAAAGALIVVLGVAFFLKLAIDEGWIRRIAPVWRCIGVAAFGGVLIGLGEIARKRINALASSGLSGAGIATVYAAVFGAHEVFGLISAPVAMVLLACVTGGGVALGVVGRRVLLSVISLVGAYVAPVLLNTGDPSPVFFPAYLVALLALGLVLGAWMGMRFHVLRGVAWWGTVLLGTVWMVDWAMDAAPINALVFIGVVWALTHAELVASARFFRGVVEAVEPVESSFGLTERTARRIGAHARWLVSSFGVTTWALGFGILVFRRMHAASDFLAPVFLGVGLAAVALVAMPRIMEIVTTRRTPRRDLAVCAVIQIGAMVIAAVALGLTDWSQVVAWLALGVAAVVAGERIGGGGVRALRFYGAVLMAIGTVRVVAWDWIGVQLFSRTGAGEVWIEGWGLSFGPIAAQVLAAGVAWFLGAVAVRRRTAESVAMASIGVACAMAAVVGPESHAGSVAVVWALLGLGLAVLSRTGCVPRVGVVALGPCLAAWGPWVFAHGDPQTWIESARAPLMSVGLLQAGAIAGSGLVGLAVVRRSDRVREALVVVGAVTAFMGLVATSLEVHRVMDLWVPGDPTARRGAVSIWWALVGVVALVVGSVRRVPRVRWVGLGLLAAAAGKLVVFDLAEISMVWRVVASMVIGVILLGVAVGYARAMRGKRDVPAGA
jgi:uncharacterized membrane protein